MDVILVKHLGDITKINGNEAPVVDCIIGGSPCQDLSIAGRRDGLAGERSGLFMEQVRIVKEMREEDRKRGRTGDAIRPRFMVWENVPGAFSSNEGADFKAVLEEIIRIAEPEAPDIPLPPKGKWHLADAYYGDGWSVAYRVLDAQFWGVPQRRRRIALVADFGGRSAPEILFVRKSVQGNIDESEPKRKEAAGDIGTCTGTSIALRMRAGCDGGGKGALVQVEKSGTLGCSNDQTIFCVQSICMETGQDGTEVTEGIAPTLNCNHEQPIVLTFPENVANTLRAQGQLSFRGDQDNIVLQLFENHGNDSRLTGPLDIAPTVVQRYGSRGNNTPLVVAAAFSGAMGAKAGNIGYSEEQCPTLSAERHDATVVYAQIVPPVAAVDCRNGTINTDVNGTLQAKSSGGTSINLQNVVLTTSEGGTFLLDGNPCTVINLLVRRLTPVECERLQGYPDGWTDIGEWVDSNGKLHKESSDSSRYKALGNSIALPPWKWVLKRICACYERDATMASLFDGIGGFSLIWEQLNGKGSCLWASEIESFPIAVTERRFNGK